MNHAAILRYIAFASGAVGLSALLPLLFALSEGEAREAGALGLSVFFGLVILAFVIVLVPKPKARTQARDLLAGLAGWWLLAPLIAAPVFMTAPGQTELTQAYFEATGCLTTTGTSLLGGGVFGEVKLPVSLIVWRGVLHAFGAIASLAGALTILPALNFGGASMHRSRLYSGTAEGFFVTFTRTLRTAAGVLFALGALLAFLLILTGLAPARAVSLAVSTVTTGLVDPLADRMIATGPAARIIILCGLFLSTISFPLLLAVRSWPVSLLRDTEAMAILAAMTLAGLAASWLGGIGLRLDGFLWAAAQVSTSGVMSEPLASGLGDDAGYLTLLLVFVGGSALSTAGGLKVTRILVLSERSRVEFNRLGFRHSVAPFVYRGRVRDDIVVVGVWVYAIAYLMAAIVLAMILSFVSGDFEQAMMSAVGLLSNAGHLVDIPLQGATPVIGAIAMIAGRLEVLAILPLMRRELWRA